MANLFHEALLLIIATFSHFSLALPVKNSLLALNHTAFLQEKKELKVALDAAAKLDPHQLTPPYSFSLYHRDMFERSNFTDYNSLLEARIARDVSRSIYLASLFGSFEDNSKVDTGPPFTGSVSFTGEYVVSFWLGSQLERELLLLDTGSPLVWWQCGPCEPNKCYYQNTNPIYNSTASPSFQEVDCIVEIPSCILPHNMTTCSEESHRCAYQIQYGSNQLSKGYMAHETLTFPLTEASRRIVFGCGKDQTSSQPFNGHFAGIAGLGGGLDPVVLGRFSLPVQLNTTLFSFCLPTSSSMLPSSLFFNTSPWTLLDMYNVKASILRDDNDQSFYYVQLALIRIGGEFPIEVQTPSWNGRVFVDTGSPYTHLPRGVYSSMLSYIKYWLSDKAVPVEAPDSPFNLCYNTDDINLSDFPSVELIFNRSDSRTLYLAKEQVATEYRGRYCLAIVPADGPYAYIGNTQLYGTALTFDFSAAMTLTFTQNSCF